jgi:hypothetical protein
VADFFTATFLASVAFPRLAPLVSRHAISSRIALTLPTRRQSWQPAPHRALPRTRGCSRSKSQSCRMSSGVVSYAYLSGVIGASANDWPEITAAYATALVTAF